LVKRLVPRNLANSHLAKAIARAIGEYLESALNEFKAVSKVLEMGQK
jgi:hypothetical protein